MTAERRRALLMMSATFVIGVVIGVLATGLFARQFYHGGGNRSIEKRDMKQGSRYGFVNKIYDVVKADSAQTKLMKPIVQQTVAHIDSLQERGAQEARQSMDLMKSKLQQILKADQMERLEKFLSKSHKPEKERERGKRKRG